MACRKMSAMVLGVVILLSCRPSTAEPDPAAALPGDLVGIWILTDKDDEHTQVFTRAASLTGDRPGYAFGPRGGLMVRQAGWCATPQATWSNIEGLWNLSGKGLLDIHHPGRNGPREVRLEIVSITQRRLVCRVQNDPGSADRP